MAEKSRRKHPASKPKKFEPVPKEFHTVTPYLAINGDPGHDELTRK